MAHKLSWKQAFLQRVAGPLLGLIAIPILALAFVVTTAYILGKMLFGWQSWSKASSGLTGLATRNLLVPTANQGSQSYGRKYPKISLPRSVGDSEFAVPAGKDSTDQPVILEVQQYKRDISSSRAETPLIILTFIGNGQALHFSYLYEMSRLAGDRPCIVYGYNRRSTGHSSGKLTCGRELLQDAEAIFDFVQTKHPDASILCAGLSLGGAEATHVTALGHAKNSSAPKPRLLNLHSFSNTGNVIIGQATTIIGPGIGHMVGGLIAAFAWMIGVELSSTKSWNKIPEAYKTYQVIQSDKELNRFNTRYDAVITNYGALHSQWEVKLKRKSLKKSLKTLKEKALNAHDKEAMELAEQALLSIKNHKLDTAEEYENYGGAINESLKILLHAQPMRAKCRGTAQSALEHARTFACTPQQEREDNAIKLQAAFTKFNVDVPVKSPLKR